jgi:hypothetical protein
MKTEPMSVTELKLGTLVYRAVPTSGSVIVYSNAQGRWGRVPIQEVRPSPPGEALLRVLMEHRPARWMAGGLVLAVACMCLGFYGLTLGRRAEVHSQVHVPVTTRAHLTPLT